MKRQSHSLAACLVALAAVTVAPAAAQDALPAGDIKLIAAFPAGSGADIVVRYYADKLKGLSGRTVIVENRPGAGGNIATEFVARSKPDGLTIYLHTGSSMSANMHVYKNPPVDVAKAMQAVAPINQQAFMLVVHPDKPWKSVAELTAAMKAKGEKATYAVSANSGVVMCALYNAGAALKAVEVKYRMAQDSMNDLASGAADFGCHDPQFTMGQLRQGKIRVLGVASAERMRAAPELPTMQEQGVPMDVNGWFAAFVPSATPRPVVDQLNTWFNSITTSEDGKKFLNQFASDPWPGTPEDAQNRLIKDIKQWGDYVRIAKIQQQG
jgi:tripartite-type tricarboxylate transporter receptor subunit TctC